MAFAPIEAGRSRTDYEFISLKHFQSLKSADLEESSNCILKVVLSYQDVFDNEDRTSSGALLFFGWDETNFFHSIEEMPWMGEELVENASIEHDQILEKWRRRMQNRGKQRR